MADPITCSGLMYQTVPSNWPVAVIDAAAATRAMPKSVINARPLLRSIRMFFCLDVAIDDRSAVCVVERARDLFEQWQRFGGSQRPRGADALAK